MFSALNQGSLIHILDKTDGLKYKVGEFIGSTPSNNFGSNIGTPSFPNFNGLINLKIKIDGNTIDYPDAQSSSSIASYNNGNVIISETKEGIVSQIETIIQNNKQIIANVPNLEKQNEDGESILRELSPQFAKDKERDDRIDGLSNRVDGMQTMLDKIYNIVSKNNSLPNIKIQ